MPLAETSEGRYASIAAAMSDSGDWVVPRYNGSPHLEKPPLTYWLAAASIRLLGKTELAVRLPVLLAAIGLVLATAWLGAALFGARTGLLAAAML
ncbi:MAG: glycosyltransferase family 39 protein, partial [Planctomycetota bacterium]